MRTGALSGVFGFVAGFIAAMLLALAAGWVVYFRGGSRVDISQPTVIQHIQQLQRLETVVYSMEKIVTGSQDSPYLPSFLAGDRILLLVYGEVTAGIDLGKLTDAMIDIDGKKATVQLPPAEIFSARIDNARTQVYSRETGLLVRPSPTLETDARRAAERQVQQAALDSGILKIANDNGRATIEHLLEGLGFESVTIR